MALCSHHSKSSRWRQPWCISHQILNRSSFLYWTTISLWITRKLANLSGFKERSWRNGGCRNSLYEMGWHDHPRSRFHRQTNYENLPLPVLLGVVDMSRDSSITPEKSKQHRPFGKLSESEIKSAELLELFRRIQLSAFPMELKDRKAGRTIESISYSSLTTLTPTLIRFSIFKNGLGNPRVWRKEWHQ